MTTIIAARLAESSDVEETVGALKEAGFAEDDIQVFYVSPAGQHQVLPLGGDETADAGAKKASKTVLGGAAAGAGAGALIGSVAGPLGAAIGAGVGAYTGSMVGGLAGMEDKPARGTAQPGQETPVRTAGEHVAVHAESPEEQASAIEILYAHNGQYVERAEGTWRDGSWVDFDPLAPLTIVAEPKSAQPRP